MICPLPKKLRYVRMSMLLLVFDMQQGAFAVNPVACLMQPVLVNGFSLAVEMALGRRNFLENAPCRGTLRIGNALSKPDLRTTAARATSAGGNIAGISGDTGQ